MTEDSEKENNWVLYGSIFIYSTCTWLVNIRSTLKITAKILKHLLINQLEIIDNTYSKNFILT